MNDRRLTPYHRLYPEGWPRWVLVAVAAGCTAFPFVLAWAVS